MSRAAPMPLALALMLSTQAPGLAQTGAAKAPSKPATPKAAVSVAPIDASKVDLVALVTRLQRDQAAQEKRLAALEKELVATRQLLGKHTHRLVGFSKSSPEEAKRLAELLRPKTEDSGVSMQNPVGLMTGGARCLSYVHEGVDPHRTSPAVEK